MVRVRIRPGQQARRVVPLPLVSSGPPPVQCGTTTATGDFAPNNDTGHSAAPGNIGYWNALFPAGQIMVPTPGAAGGWSFPAYGSAGSPDAAGDCVGNNVRFVFAGLGVASLDINMQGHNWVARLYHLDGTVMLDQTKSGGPGDSVVSFRVTECSPDGYHWIDLTDNGPFCGTKWLFVGAHWELEP